MLRKVFALAVVPVVCSLADQPVQAELPHVSYIFPAGGQRGSDVEFHVGGHFLHEGCDFQMQGQGVSASPRIERTETTWFEGPVIPMPASQRKEDYPKDYLGRVAIGAGRVTRISSLASMDVTGCDLTHEVRCRRPARGH